jgi:hypothetical protein
MTEFSSPFVQRVVALLKAPDGLACLASIPTPTLTLWCDFAIGCGAWSNWHAHAVTARLATSSESTVCLLPRAMVDSPDQLGQRCAKAALGTALALAAGALLAAASLADGYDQVRTPARRNVTNAGWHQQPFRTGRPSQRQSPYPTDHRGMRVVAADGCGAPVMPA